ncbi:unnamed protein product [Closterium sp. Naga37s-1]|nr:unnamed protein product [Closterium sp. Naga37s-1]
MHLIMSLSSLHHPASMFDVSEEMSMFDVSEEMRDLFWFVPRCSYMHLLPCFSHPPLPASMFDVSEEMRDLFWFVRDMDEPAPTNPVLQRHANTAFKLVSGWGRGGIGGRGEGAPMASWDMDEPAPTNPVLQRHANTAFKLPAPTNPVLQRHANTAFKLICDSCCQLDDRAAVAGMLPAMQGLGGRHIKYNVRRPHMALTPTVFSLPFPCLPPLSQVFRMAFL